MLRLTMLLIVAATVTACASMGNTLAQDLAYEAWHACPHASTMVLERIETNGTIWVQWRSSPYGVTEWQNCIRQYYAEVAAKKRSVGQPQMVVANQQVVGPIVAPIWKAGDEWAYRYESPTGNGTYVWSVDREETIDGVPHYVIKTGTREIFYRKSDFATTRETVDGAIVLSIAPSRLGYMWPLEVGKTWEQAFHEERPVARQTEERLDAMTVEAEETITVPAGTFKTLKIVYRNKNTNAIRYEAWYAPELKQVIRLRERLASGLRTRELITYKLR